MITKEELANKSKEELIELVEVLQNKMPLYEYYKGTCENQGKILDAIGLVYENYKTDKFRI